MKKVLSLAMALLLIMTLAMGCSTTAGKEQKTDAAFSSLDLDHAGNSVNDSSATDGISGSYVYKPLYDPDIPADQLSDLQVPFENIPTAEAAPLPLAADTATISAWIVFQSSDYGTISDTPVEMELERRTNVHVNYSCSSTSYASESFQLLISSGDYTDILFGADYYNGSPDKAIADGIYLRLNDLINEYAPNYTMIRHLSEDHARGSITDSGNLYGFCDMLLTAENPWCGLVVRQDWLDDLGLTAPVTLDEWEDMMEQFIIRKDAFYGVCTNPIFIDANNNDEFITTFDVNASFFQKDGKVRFGPIEDGYLDYLTLAKRWYEKGYLDPDFFRYSNYSEYLHGDAYMQLAEGHVGAAQSLGLVCGVQLYNHDLTDDPEVNFITVQNPLRNVGDTTHFRQLTSVIKKNGGGAAAAVTTRAEDPVLCTKWLDYRYTRSGARLLNYGVEGYNYAFHEESQTITYTKDFVNFDTGLENAFNYYVGQSTISMQATIYSTERGSIHTGEDYRINTERWAADGYDYVIPVNASFASVADSTEFYELYADIKTYVNQITIRFITGLEPLSNFPQFVSRIKAMGIDRCVELKQSGLESYYNRPLD